MYIHVLTIYTYKYRIYKYRIYKYRIYKYRIYKYIQVNIERKRQREYIL